MMQHFHRLILNKDFSPLKDMFYTQKINDCITYQGSPWVWKTPVQKEEESSKNEDECCQLAIVDPLHMHTPPSTSQPTNPKKQPYAGRENLPFHYLSLLETTSAILNKQCCWKILPGSESLGSRASEPLPGSLWAPLL